MRSFNSLLTVLVLSFSSIAAVGCATSGADDDLSEVDGEAAAAGKVAIWQSTDGQWRFNLKSGNGSILLTSEAYTSRTGAINGILSVLDNGVDPAMYKVSQSATGYVVHLTAPNHEIISFSEVYSSKSNATRAIASCVRATTSYLDKREGQTTGARVEIRRGETKFSFAFYAKNGEQVLASEAYDSHAAALNGAFATQAAGNYNLKTAADGKHYFTITAANNQVVAISQMYTTKASAQRAMDSMKTLLPTISVL